MLLLILPSTAMVLPAVLPAPAWAAESPVAPEAAPKGDAAPKLDVPAAPVVPAKADAPAALPAPPVPAPAKKTAARPAKVIHTGATWYGPGFYGHRTASGERFNRNAMTLASRHLPFGTQLRVTNLKNGKASLARVNDRGPFGRSGYTVDLSEGLARRIGMLSSGPVRLEILPKPEKRKPAVTAPVASKQGPVEAVKPAVAQVPAAAQAAPVEAAPAALPDPRK
jgi:rare lipoprotein A